MLLPLVLKSPDKFSINGPESLKCINEFYMKSILHNLIDNDMH